MRGFIKKWWFIVFVLLPFTLWRFTYLPGGFLGEWIAVKYADRECRMHFFDGTEFNGGEWQCHISVPTTDGFSETLDIPVRLASNYDLEAFNMREAKCKPPRKPLVDWNELHRQQHGEIEL